MGEFVKKGAKRASAKRTPKPKVVAPVPVLTKSKGAVRNTSQSRVRELGKQAAHLKQMIKRVHTDHEVGVIAVKKSTHAKSDVPIKGLHSSQLLSKRTNSIAPSIRVKNTTSRRSGVRPDTSPDSKPTPLQTTTDVEVVVVPTAASERLIAKARALSIWYKVRFPQYAAKTAYVAGCLFITAAASILASQATTQYQSWEEFQQAALCATLPCIETVQSGTSTVSGNDSSTSTVDTTPGSIKFRTSPPSPLKENFNIIVRAEKVRDVSVFVESRANGTTKQITASPDSSGEDKRFLIDPGLLSAGEYQLRATARSLSDEKIITLTGPRFTIEGQLAALPTPGLSPDTQRIPNIASTTKINEEKEQASTTAKQSASSTAKAITTLPLPTAEEAKERVQFSLSETSDGTYAVKLKITGATRVEIFAQRAQANEPFFLGSAKRFDGDYWHYAFPPTALPNGNYSIFARATLVTGAVAVSTRLPLTVRTPPPGRTALIEPTAAMPTNTPQATTTSAPVLPAAKQIETLEYEGVTIERTKYLGAPPIEVKNVGSVEAVTPLPASSERKVTEFVDSQLNDNADTVNGLLKRYASAVASNDESLKQLARKELESKQSVLTKAALVDSEASPLAFEIEERFEQEFDRLQRRVEKFESLLKDRNSDVLSKDTDGDGISDHDENLLYDTDPTNTDTDGDGIQDGIEITGGFDPNNADAESMMRFTSPKEFGLIRDDVLQVTAVTPVLETDSTRGTPPVQAEIRGKALPNSFVTLFIYSTPVVVTVKTDADGSFVYQFDRELEDGAHEVYVAVTDNTGDVLAKSNPFKFVKQAEAFTVTSEPDTYITTEPGGVRGTTNVFNTVVALGVLTFGLILVIIGLVLRREQPTIVTESVVSSST